MRLMWAAVLMLVALPALADEPLVYTGCIAKSNGSLYNVAVGTTPMQPCKAKDTQISWNMAGQPGPEGPEGPSLPRWRHEFVNCDNGESVNDALARQAEGITVDIRGTCHEQVSVRRDHVILQAADPNDPPTIISPGQVVTLVIESRSVEIYDLKIKAITAGVGIEVRAGSFAKLHGCEIWGGDMGVYAHELSTVDLSGSFVHDVAHMAFCVESSVIAVGDTRVEGNGDIARSSQGQLYISNSLMTHNAGSLNLADGSSAVLQSSDVSATESTAIHLTNASSIHILESTVNANAGDGVYASGHSSVYVGRASTISNNRDHGINLGENSYFQASAEVRVADNGGAGLAAFLATFNLTESTFSGNAAGAIRCELSYGVCAPAHIDGSVSGCGPRCPNQD